MRSGTRPSTNSRGLSHWWREPEDLRGIHPTLSRPLVATGVFDEDLDSLGFMKPGNLQGGFDWYISTNESRLDLIRNGPPWLPKSRRPPRPMGGTRQHAQVEWADRLGDYFADLDFAPMREAGHFAHYERPDLANREISDFFRAIA